MATLAELKRFIRPQDPTRALPDDPFIVIDRERTVAKLKLDERAKDRGSRNFPPADSKVLDDVEEEIVAEVMEHANRDRSGASLTHRVYNERLSELALLRELSSIAGASAQALGDYKATLINRVGRLALAKDAIRDSYRELSAFRATHGLNRPAHGGLGSIYAISIVAISWLAESALNTVMLKVNDDLGWLGGFVAAAVVAAVNVFLSALVGRYWWPYLFHRSTVRKILAAAGSAAWLALIVVWNLLAGHFRDSKSAGVERPETEAMGLLIERTWQFDSIYSYGLLGAGLAFAVLAATAAYKMKDPYPGYGDIYKRHQDRCDEYSDEIEYALDDLKETRDEAIAVSEDLADELRRQFGERGQIIAAREAHRHRFRERQEFLEGIANFLLSRYRSGNLQTRPDGQVPVHFGERWTLSLSELPVDHDESIEAAVLNAQKALSDSIKTIESAYEEAIETFEHLNKIKESLGHG